MVTTFCYWLTAGLYMLMDYTQKPGFLMKYKIQEGKNTPPNTAKTIKVSKASEASFSFFKLMKPTLKGCHIQSSYSDIEFKNSELCSSFACSENSESELCERQVFFHCLAPRRDSFKMHCSVVKKPSLYTQ